MILIVFALVLIWVPNNCVHSSCIDRGQYDYIVVGSGSSGGVVATRLSEDPNIKVLLLEAGVEPLRSSEIPLTAFTAMGSVMDWNYFTEKQKHCCKMFKGNKVLLYRGKALGGTSSLNYMAYTRGHKKDYDDWSEKNPGWSYDDVLPYFRKLEDMRVPVVRNGVEFGKGGPVAIEFPTYKTPLAQSFLEAGDELKFQQLANNAEMEQGFFYPPVTMKDGIRCSTWQCYIKPAMNRTNLHVITGAMATKILINNQKEAYGVKYERQKSKCQAMASKEVIVSGGSYGTPHLLLLSGIGPKQTLRKHLIKVIADLPGVGQNLQDHVILGNLAYTLVKKVSYHFGRYNTTENMNLWERTRTGPMTCPNAFEGIAFYQTKYETRSDWPDMEVYYTSDSIIRFVRNLIDPLLVLVLPSDEAEVITFLPFLLRPKSRGYVTLRSTNPHDHPIIQPNYLSHPNDVDVLVEGMKFTERIANTKGFKKYGINLFNSVLGLKIVPQCLLFYVNKKEFYKCLVRNFSTSGNHVTSTCRMGPRSDPMAVVDNRLRVHGVQRLRVADASIMPNIISGHPNGPCMMIGEKVSDMIKEDNKA